jgi:hypothetical protein
LRDECQRTPLQSSKAEASSTSRQAGMRYRSVARYASGKIGDGAKVT